MLDATYKTTNYSLPLFFVVERETSITKSWLLSSSRARKLSPFYEALPVIKSWNSEWNPSYFMLDYSEEEMSAINRLFHGKDSQGYPQFRS